MKKNCPTCKYYNYPLHKEPCESCAKDGWRANYEAKEETVISHPVHYQSKSGLEVIDVIKAFADELIGMEAVYTGNVIKYICRWKKKNGVEDLKKARQYLDWLIEMEEKDTKRGMFDEKILENQTKASSEPIKPLDYLHSKRNGRYSWSEVEDRQSEEKDQDLCNCETNEKTDCKVPWKLQPHMAPTYEYPSPSEKDNKPTDLLEMFWTEFCKVFCEKLNEVIEEDKKEKENKKDEE